MKGVEGTILRRPGGPTKNQIKNDPGCANIRRNNMEFGGRSTAASNVRRTMPALHHLADYNFLPEINKLFKTVQYGDTLGKKGQRSVYYSRHRYILDGFNLNRVHPFDTVVRHHISCTIDRQAGTASIVLPQLAVGNNLFLPWAGKQFRFIATLGVANDCLFTEQEYKKDHLNESQAVQIKTAWEFCNKPYAGETLVLQIKYTERLHEDCSLIASLGIEVELPYPEKYGSDFQRIGCAKILGAG